MRSIRKYPKFNDHLVHSGENWSTEGIILGQNSMNNWFTNLVDNWSTRGIFTVQLSKSNKQLVHEPGGQLVHGRNHPRPKFNGQLVHEFSGQLVHNLAESSSSNFPSPMNNWFTNPGDNWSTEGTILGQNSMNNWFTNLVDNWSTRGIFIIQLSKLNEQWVHEPRGQYVHGRNHPHTKLNERIIHEFGDNCSMNEAKVLCSRCYRPATLQ